MQVILSARAAWAVANDVVVVENVRTAPMMVRKSRVEIGMLLRWCGSARRNTFYRGGTRAMGL